MPKKKNAEIKDCYGLSVALKPDAPAMAISARLTQLAQRGEALGLGLPTQIHWAPLSDGDDCAFMEGRDDGTYRLSFLWKLTPEAADALRARLAEAPTA